MSFKISARNSLKGTVIEIQTGATTSIVKLKVRGEVLSSSITNEAIQSLSLVEGMEAYGIIKASSVLIAVVDDCSKLRISARNKFCGRVSSITNGVVTSIVKVDLECGQSISSSITVDAVKDLNLEVGSKVCAIIKSSCVMIGVE